MRRAWSGAGRDELVACREQCHPRPRSDQQAVVSECCRDADVDAGQRLSGEDHLVAATDIGAARAHTRAEFGCDLDEHHGTVTTGVLLAHNGVSAFRHGSAGHDSHGGPGGVSSGKCTRPRLADDRKCRRCTRTRTGDIACPDGISVHGGVVETREIRLRRDGLGEDSSECRVEAHDLRCEHANLLEQPLLRGGD
jgi:hypothetical protein